MANSAITSTPEIAFTKNWNECVQGNLIAGKKFKVSYYAFRMCDGEAFPIAKISAFVRFRKDQEPIAKLLNATEDSPIMFQEFDIPENVDELEIWFIKIDSSGNKYYDTDYGRNYCFRCESKDVTVKSASVSTSWPTPYSGFSLEISSVAAVEYVSIQYKPKPNFGGAEADLWTQAELSCGGDSLEEEKRIWTIYQNIPYGATVLFVIIYKVNGQCYTNDNNGKGFFVGKTAI